MAMKDALLPEFDHEMGMTRTLLERVPDDRLAWKPHERSMTLARLATHLAEVPGWVGTMLNESAFDTGGLRPPPRESGSRHEILDLFDRNVAAARETIVGKSDAELMAPWTLKRDGRDLFTVPKVALLRSFLLSHVIHHRGQLSVYLRLNEVSVPAIYGPSADERR